MEVRRAKLEELPELIELQTRSLQELSKEHYTPEEIAAIVENQIEGRTLVDEICFVAEDEGQIVGFAGILKEKSRISAMYVDPNWARQGIGSTLLAAVEAEAKQRGVRTLSVLSSLMAIPFYESQGFAILWSTELPTQSRLEIRCKELAKSLVPKNSESERAARHEKLLGMGILLLFLGFIFSRPWTAFENMENQNRLEMLQRKF
jgi:putative acetyltransferase